MALNENPAFSAHGYLVFSAPFLEETALPLLSVLGTLVKSHLTTYVTVYSWPSVCSARLPRVPVLCVVLCQRLLRRLR